MVVYCARRGGGATVIDVAVCCAHRGTAGAAGSAKRYSARSADVVVCFDHRGAPLSPSDVAVYCALRGGTALVI
jgi:hypothetical protein